MSNMSREEFLRLQREAETRMREMQKRSDEITGKMPPAPNFVALRNDEKPEPEQVIKKSPHRKNGGGLDLLRMLNLGDINLDSDRVLLLAIMLLLIGESNDELLLLALLYIML